MSFNNRGTADPRNREAPPELPPEELQCLPGSKPILSSGGLATKQLQPKRMSHRLKYVAQLAAMGLTNAEICQRTGYSQVRLSVVLRAPVVSNEVELTRKYIFATDVERAQKVMLPKALEAIHDVLNHEPVDFREKKSMSETAFALIERTHGKATQKIEASGTLLADLYSMLDARAAAAGTWEATAQEVTEAEIIPEAPQPPRVHPQAPGPDAFAPSPNALDAYLDKNLPALSKEPLK